MLGSYRPHPELHPSIEVSTRRYGFFIAADSSSAQEALKVLEAPYSATRDSPDGRGNLLIGLRRKLERFREPDPTPAPREPLGEEVAARLLDLVYRYVSRRVVNREDVADLTGEILLHVTAQFPNFRGEGRMESWLFRIAERRLSRSRRRMQRWASVAVEALLPEHEDTVADPAGEDPAAIVQRRERICHTIRVVQSLPPDQREALLLMYAEGLSQEEIGQVMGRSTEAVNSLLQRARKAARKLGGSYYLTGEPGGPR
ncbi:MAG: RNA polymerase sigma factor [Armatimonadota bacterium]